MFTIVTGRYNNETWESTMSYRLKKGLQCIYAPPCKLSSNIDLDSPVFVIEMNNSVNEIMGIGLIKNKLVTDKVYKVQKDTNCNRYIYIGEYHISREILDDYNPDLVYVLDEILFKGYTHSKRGSGLTKLPEKVLTLEICDEIDIKKEIKNIFIYHFRDKIQSKKIANKQMENKQMESNI
jgi:hypothetical protein